VRFIARCLFQSSILVSDQDRSEKMEALFIKISILFREKALSINLEVDSGSEKSAWMIWALWLSSRISCLVFSAASGELL